jgi:hypothetical protein
MSARTINSRVDVPPGRSPARSSVGGDPSTPAGTFNQAHEEAEANDSTIDIFYLQHVNRNFAVLLEHLGSYHHWIERTLISLCFI